MWECSVILQLVRRAHVHGTLSGLPKCICLERCRTSSYPVLQGAEVAHIPDQSIMSLVPLFHGCGWLQCLLMEHTRAVTC